MCNTAAHIVDRIIPSVPVRQWVLPLPFDVRARAAYDARFLTDIIRTFARALGDHSTRRPRRQRVEEAHYNLEASVRIAADDDFGREHLLRYCARLIELPHGKLGYRIKKLRNHRKS